MFYSYHCFHSHMFSFRYATERSVSNASMCHSNVFTRYTLTLLLCSSNANLKQICELFVLISQLTSMWKVNARMWSERCSGAVQRKLETPSAAQVSKTPNWQTSNRAKIADTTCWWLAFNGNKKYIKLSSSSSFLC